MCVYVCMCMYVCVCVCLCVCVCTGHNTQINNLVFSLSLPHSLAARVILPCTLTPSHSLLHFITYTHSFTLNCTECMFAHSLSHPSALVEIPPKVFVCVCVCVCVCLCCLSLSVALPLSLCLSLCVCVCCVCVRGSLRGRESPPCRQCFCR